MANADTARLIATLELKDLFTKRISAAESALGKFESRSTKAGRQIGLGILRGAAVAAAGVGAFGAIFAKSLGAASDLNETTSKTAVVFGKNAKAVLDFGHTASSSLGLSEQAADEAAATYGNLFVSLGLTSGKASKMSIAMVKLAGDLASFNNASPEDTLLAIQSGLVGETEPLRKYGINLNDATLRQEAMRLGLTKTTKEVLPPAIKAQAAYSLILKQSGTAQGDFQRTSGGLANQIRILKANFTDMMATLAAPALPAVAKIFQRLNAEIKDNQPAIADLGNKIAGLFSDSNISAGFGAIKEGFQIAKDAAPVIADAARITGSAMKIAVDAFKSLPPDLQRIAIAGLAINKLTGGLVTNLAGGIIETIAGKVAKSFAQRGGTPANPLFVADVAGGLGGGVPGAGGSGGLLGVIKSAAKWIVPLAVGVAVVELAQDLNNTKVNSPTVTGTETRPGGVFGRPSPTSGGSSLGDRDLRDIAQFTSGTENNVGKMADDVAALPGSMRDLRETFSHDLQTLIHATKALDVQKAARKIGDEIGKGIGNAANTEKTLAALKTQLLHTDDPKTRAVLKAQIERVHNVLPDRQFAAKQYGSLNKILADGKITTSENKQIHRIMAAVKDRGLPAVSKTIAARVDAAKNAQKAGDAAVKLGVAGVKGAVKALKLNPRIIVPITSQATTIINGRSFVGTVNRQSVLVRPGQASVAS